MTASAILATIVMLGQPYKVRIETETYRDNGSTAVTAMMDDDSGEQFATLSCNLPESERLAPGIFYGKHWSENEGFLEQLVAQDIIEPVPHMRPTHSGFVDNIRAYRLKE